MATVTSKISSMEKYKCLLSCSSGNIWHIAFLFFLNKDKSSGQNVKVCTCFLYITQTEFVHVSMCVRALRLLGFRVSHWRGKFFRKPSSFWRCLKDFYIAQLRYSRRKVRVLAKHGSGQPTSFQPSLSKKYRWQQRYITVWLIVTNELLLNCFNLLRGGYIAECL